MIKFIATTVAVLFCSFSAFAEYTWGGIKRTKSEFKSVFRHRTFGSEFESEEYAFIDSFDSPVKEWTNILLKKDFEKMMVTDTDSLEVSSNEVVNDSYSTQGSILITRITRFVF